MKTLNKLLVGIGLCTCLPYLATAEIIGISENHTSLGGMLDVMVL